ncbi:uroporphyrinogen-III synthase [Sphingomonas sp. S-NIH.Pt15_0812]|uniref:uroporphyrinogen-III synthase n=1 Tax=Sphingomonas sp. S-NIH.Pt15_0812 TaxID=1920129 RepID=UPI000F7F4211|nr:uroporphyrinogen-III synthase [Sphingomonas sp. S-NIH.Pt15_0812]RSU50554.1 uroporphyrinogen-III synthase [Sphingomonas sp. S-NIH.Pt15_0812]
MTRPIAVLRPEPGNGRTADRLAALGATVIRRPLFAIVPVAWTPPDPAGFDALVLTSANAVRHADIAATSLARLPVWAVGSATAAAARAAGLRVVRTGAAGVAALTADRGETRLLHLAGRERMAVPGVTAITVYAADPRPVTPADWAGLSGSVALLHSARAARALAAGGVDRARIRLAALSPAILTAAGPGWGRSTAVAVPEEDALLAAAIALAD